MGLVFSELSVNDQTAIALGNGMVGLHADPFNQTPIHKNLAIELVNFRVRPEQFLDRVLELVLCAQAERDRVSDAWVPRIEMELFDWNIVAADSDLATVECNLLDVY